MVAVLLVLMALFILSAPFLVTVRNADQASSESSDRSVLRVTLDSGARHAAAGLAASHPGLDETPYSDDLAEIEVGTRFPAEFLATGDPTQAMWDVDAEDIAARIDLASASPHVLANLIGGAARLAAACKDDDAELQLVDTEGLLPEGVVFVDDEVIGYGELGPTTLGRLARGLLFKASAEEEPSQDVAPPFICGPTPPSAHEVGAYVLDQRAWALCEWRIASGKLRVYEGIEQVREAQEFVLAPELGREAFLALARTASTFGHVRAGARWQRPARVLADPDGTPDYGCRLPVDDLRWFNPGTTVRITDGKESEYALVRTTQNGAIVLTAPLRRPFQRLRTLVAPLARTPVNVNTAGPEVLEALWTNLKLRGKSARITAGEAEQLVDLVLVSRPFTGFEDFLRRIVLPAGGLDELPADAPIRPEALEELARQARHGEDGEKVQVGFIDPDDAIALYKNALNANDNELEFATMPLAFTSRDVYRLDVRAAINAPSGVERARGVRELCELIVPQRDLLTVWTRQEDFDDSPRLDRDAAGWLTGPVPTSRFDPLYGVVSSLRWPSRARAHLGPWDTSAPPTPEEETTRVYCFATRADEDGWAQLAANREEDEARQASYALHFDDETETLEGRYLPDRTAELDLAKLGWSGAPTATAAVSANASGGGSLMTGMACSLWIQPRTIEEGARLLDVGGPYKDADRLSLLFEGGNLVLRVLDGAGDHPDSSFEEVAEVRYPLAEGPGLPADVWSHVQVAVDGNRPDQMALWVDGRRADVTPGLTRLTSAVTGESDTLLVESTDGFPEKGVVRIGDELIEVTKQGPKAFTAKYESLGENAGFGGRIAREMFQGADPEVNQGLSKDIDHPSGATVQLYGYSLPVFSNVSSAASNLESDLGNFAVARVVGVVLDGSERTESGMEPIQMQGTYGPFDIGHGFDGVGEELDGLLLMPADANRSLADTMAAFSTEGGYAAILGPILEDPNTEEPWKDVNDIRIGGVEVVRYTGWEDGRLNLDIRGGGGLKLPSGKVAGRASFVVYHGSYTGPAQWWRDRDKLLHAQVMVIPISIPARNLGGVAGFLAPSPTRSEFLQITHSGGESDQTEWARYDEFSPEGFFCRSETEALINADKAAHAWIIVRDPVPTAPNPNNSQVRAAGFTLPAAEPPATVAARARAEPAPQQGGNSYWFHAMGEAEDEDFPVARATNSWFQFRGVLGTYAHPHPRGTLVLPVFRTRDLDETSGRPGRFDEVLFMPEAPEEPGFPGLVHHAHRPLEHPVYSWENGGSDLTAVAREEVVSVQQFGLMLGLTYVALADRLAVPFAPSPIGDATTPTDNRLLARMVLFPSGELPRRVQQGQLGGDVHDEGGVPSAIVDEALFFPLRFGVVSGSMPGQLVLAGGLAEGDTTFQAVKDTLRTTVGDLAFKTNVLTGLPEHGGLLRIGDELLCYDSYDADSFTFTIPDGGRGLLATEPQAHRATEGVTFVGALPVGVLGANVGADDALLPLLEIPPGFPSQGTVRIEDELVHYTRYEGAVLEMPRTSLEPGEMDGKGPGLFRGRYGTERVSHAAGTPVVLFPFRYWDRWSDLADAPEMTYYELAGDQPDAYWRRVFWKEGAAPAAGPQLGVLERTNQDTPWDAAPDDTNGLRYLREGKLDADGNPIGVQSDRVEWRVFVRHLPGSFDPTAGLAHGWKTTPRLELFGVEYMGPSRTLARADR